MRALRVLSICCFTSLALLACRTDGPASTPAEATPAVESGTVTAAQPEPAARTAEHGSTQAPAPSTAAAPLPNRDSHGNADVAAYIAQLENATRVAELRIDTVLAKLDLPSNAWVGDLGCGPGAFALAFAKACPEGVVFACDIEPRQLDVVRTKLKANGLRNIVPVLASADDAHFPAASLDVVFIGDTYHHLEDRVAYTKRLMKALRPGGRLVVLDYKPGKLDIGPPPEHKLKAGVMSKELIEAGWRQVETFDTHPFHDFEIWRPIQPWEKK
jgi:SAM-dependent methyltransferase